MRIIFNYDRIKKSFIPTLNYLMPATLSLNDANSVLFRQWDILDIWNKSSYKHKNNIHSLIWNLSTLYVVIFLLLRILTLWWFFWTPGHVVFILRSSEIKYISNNTVTFFFVITNINMKTYFSYLSSFIKFKYRHINIMLQ